MIEIPNGFLPILSDDGLTCACGNGQVLSVDLRTGVVTGPLETQAAPCGFYQGQIAISKYVPGGRQLLNGPIVPPVAQAPGNYPIVAVAHDRVVSSAGGQHFIDGQRVTSYDPGNSTIETNDGHHYGYKPQNIDPMSWPFWVRDLATLNLQIWIAASVSNAVVWTDTNDRPWVFANRDGRAELYNADGLIYQFPQGEFRGALSNGPEGPWAWTCGQIGADPFIYGRPFAALSGAPVVTLQGMWWAGLAVVWKPSAGQWVVAGYYNGPGGTLYINPDVTPANVPVQPQPPIVTPPNVRVISVRPGETIMIQGLP